MLIPETDKLRGPSSCEAAPVWLLLCGTVRTHWVGRELRSHMVECFCVPLTGEVISQAKAIGTRLVLEHVICDKISASSTVN